MNSRTFMAVEVGFEGGLNKSPIPTKLKDNELQEAVNFDLVDDTLVKRPGIIRRAAEVYAAAPGFYLVGQVYFPNTYNILVAVGANNKLYHSANGGTTWTEVLNGGASFNLAASKGVQYGPYLALGSTVNGVHLYDGSTATAAIVAGSPNGLTGAVVLDYFFIFNPSTQTIRFSAEGNLNSWPAANSILIVDNFNDTISAMVNYKDRLVIFRKNSIYVLTMSGTPVNWQLRKVFSGVGANGHHGVFVHDDWIYFIGQHGLYRTNLSELQEISTPIKEALRDRSSPGSTLITLDPLLTYDTVVGYQNKIYFFINYGIYTATRPQDVFVFHVDTEKWTEYESHLLTAAIKVNTAVVVKNSRNTTATDNAFPLGVYLGAWGNPRPLLIDDYGGSRVDDVNTEYSCMIKTKAFTFEDFGSHKKIPYMHLDAEIGSHIQTAIEHNDVLTNTLLAGTFDGIPRSLKTKGPGYIKRVFSKLTFTNPSGGANRFVELSKLGYAVRIPSPVGSKQVER